MSSDFLFDFTGPADVVEVCQRLCDIESVSGAESQLADVVYQALAAQPHLRVLRERNCVVAQTALGHSERIIIAGHLDTVPLSRPQPNLPTRMVEENGESLLWGRGTVDMKGGVAVALVLAVELQNPDKDITWIWYDNEEVDSQLSGLGLLQSLHPELLQADFALLAEPTGGRVEAGCNGTLRISVEFMGRSAHSARAWKGLNAIHAASSVLQRLADYEAETVEVDDLLFRESLSAVRIGGGVAGNVVPDRCRLEINYRFAPVRSVESAAKKVHEILGLDDLLAAEAVEVKLVDSAAGALPQLDNPMVADFINHVAGEPLAARGLHGGSDLVLPKLGWTDVARLSAAGVPAVNFGPGNPELAHADDERVPIAQIRSCHRTLRRWLTA